MPPFSGQLDEQQIADVAAYVSRRLNSALGFLDSLS